MPPLNWTLSVYAVAIAAGTVFGPGAVEAADPVISMELNKTEPSGAGCRFSFVLRNETGRDLPAAAYEAVLFNTDGVIDQMSVLEFGALTSGKTVVRQFEMPGVDCTKAGRLLINGPVGCTATNTPGHCSAALTVSSRSTFPLVQ
ncbi:hypothetical protein E1180_16695 [Roseibium denhamense]|uniref:Tat pathway signal sequence domain protein n=1 Tax=Roseibium denhamense TaxID=76305 RepID=A0ABY1P7T6_9HYPH|nr:hypothetical protein [Roseibium denhamense]MTI07149.1 hypothetical protein [Roseibium denhamense]SMP26839.1 hypothetical protein SAMN06265374_2809 [Roseibium denhamense]